MTYNERIRSLAEEMAKEEYPNQFNTAWINNSVDAAFNQQECEGIINQYIPLAEAIIKQIIVIVAEVCNGLTTDEINKVLFRQGLIPG